VPILVGSAALLAGVVGFRLAPDSYLYARRGLHLWPSPLGDLSGALGGMPVVIAVSAIAGGLVVAAVSAGRNRALFVTASSWWLLFPGVDALGALAVVLLYKTGHKRYWLLAGLLHPVAALVSVPLLFRRDALGVALVAFCTVAAIVGVGLADVFSTTDRYLMPLLAVVLA
jgi:hypothetical protein